MFTVGGDKHVFLKNRGLMSRRGCQVDRWRKWVFEALKETKFLLPHSEIIERSEVKRLVASSLELCSSCWMGLLLKGGGVM